MYTWISKKFPTDGTAFGHSIRCTREENVSCRNPLAKTSQAINTTNSVTHLTCFHVVLILTKSRQKNKAQLEYYKHTLTDNSQTLTHTYRYAYVKTDDVRYTKTHFTKTHT